MLKIYCTGWESISPLIQGHFDQQRYIYVKKYIKYNLQIKFNAWAVILSQYIQESIKILSDI